jgi:photosystem II stability/assembly factor-like uncharacterized protein
MIAARILSGFAILIALGVPAVAFPQRADPRNAPSFQAFSVIGDTIFAGTERHGVLRSNDGGQNWSNAGQSGRNVAALVRTPTGALVAGITGWNGQLHRSEDRGGAWPRVEIEPFVHALAVHPDGVIVASSGTKVLRSSDDGRTWQQVQHPSGSRDINALTFTPSGTLFGGGEAGVFRSSNQGRSWSRVGQWDFGTIRALAADAEGNLYAGSNQGVFRFDADAGHWVRSHYGLAAGTVWALHSAGGLLVAATDSGVAMSTDGGRTWEMRVPGGRSRALTISSDGSGLYAAVSGSTVLTGLPLHAPPATAQADAVPADGPEPGQRTLYLAWSSAGQPIYMFPFAVVGHRAFRDPRLGFYPREGSISGQQFVAATERMHQAYFPVGQSVAYGRMGNVLGVARIMAPSPPSPDRSRRCDYPTTSIELVSGERLNAGAIVVHPDEGARARRRPARPSTAQGATAREYVQRVLLDSGVPMSIAARARSLEAQPLTVADLERDGLPELMGSYEALPEREEEDGYGVVFILTQTPSGGWEPVYLDFYERPQLGKPPTRWFLDHLDADGDGMEEVIMEGTSGVYTVLKKMGGGWTPVYDAYSGMAITWCTEHQG